MAIDFGDLRQGAINALGLRPLQRALIVHKGIQLGLVTKEEVRRIRQEQKEGKN